MLIVGGTGYLGQHLLQSFADNLDGNSSFALAFTHLSIPPPHALLNAIPHALPFHVDLRTGDGFDAISDAFGQVSISLVLAQYTDLCVVNASRLVKYLNFWW